MRFNKKTQYGLLLVLHIATQTRCSTKAAASYLQLSHSFLDQVSRDLRLAGILESFRGPKGGWQIVGDPLVGDVLFALSPDAFLSEGEIVKYVQGPSEHRMLVHMVKNMWDVIQPLLHRKIKGISNELIMNERMQASVNAQNTLAN